MLTFLLAPLPLLVALAALEIVSFFILIDAYLLGVAGFGVTGFFVLSVQLRIVRPIWTLLEKPSIRGQNYLTKMSVPNLEVLSVSIHLPSSVKEMLA